MDDGRPDTPKPTAKVIPIRRKRVVHMGTLGTPDARPLPPGVEVTAMTFTRKSTGEVLERIEFKPPGNNRPDSGA